MVLAPTWKGKSKLSQRVSCTGMLCLASPILSSSSAASAGSVHFGKSGLCLRHLRLHPLHLLTALMKAVLQASDLIAHAIGVCLQSLDDLLGGCSAHQVPVSAFVVLARRGGRSPCSRCCRACRSCNGSRSCSVVVRRDQGGASGGRARGCSRFYRGCPRPDKLVDQERSDQSDHEHDDLPNVNHDRDQHGKLPRRPRPCADCM